jgi:hypothetical protein
VEGLAQVDQQLVMAYLGPLGNQAVQTEHLLKSNLNMALAQAPTWGLELRDQKTLCVSNSFIILIFNRKRKIKS